MDCDWIWIELSIHFEKWIWIWSDNHKLAKHLDWIDNPKKNWIEQYPVKFLGFGFDINVNNCEVIGNH